eukprot:13974592-Heterocapsa_arctica.AAC.1
MSQGPAPLLGRHCFRKRVPCYCALTCRFCCPLVDTTASLLQAPPVAEPTCTCMSQVDDSVTSITVLALWHTHIGPALSSSVCLHVPGFAFLILPPARGHGGSAA